MKIRGKEIEGLERVEHQAEIEEFLLKLVAEGIVLPRKIVFRKLRSCLGRASCSKSSMKISIDQTLERMRYTILHELVHTEGVNGHGRYFWRKFISFCNRMKLDPEVYFKI